MRYLCNYIIFFLVLALAWCRSCLCHPLYPKYHVHIINNLSKNTVLNLHCKSKDDDLGSHALPVSGEFRFTFRENLWRTTLFWCNFEFGNNHGGGFKVWWDEWFGNWFTYECNYKNCVWSARDDGLYLQHVPENNAFVKYYNWKS